MRYGLFFLVFFFALGGACRAQTPSGSCEAKQEGASACNKNGCYVCVSGVWKAQPFYLGKTEEVCDQNRAGLLQWTGAAFQGCDGRAWTSLIASAAPVIGSFVAPAATGNYAVTGLPFSPRFVRFVVQANRSGVMPTYSTSTCFGAMSSIKQYANYSYAGATSAAARNILDVSKVIYCGAAEAVFYDIAATYVSMDALGFTINFSKTSAAWLIVYEAWP